MNTFATRLVQIILLASVIGVGYMLWEMWMSRRSNKDLNTAPFGDKHYETVKTAFPNHAKDADTPEIIAERQRLAGNV